MHEKSCTNNRARLRFNRDFVHEKSRNYEIEFEKSRVLCTKSRFCKNKMSFENLTMAPIEKDLIIQENLNQKEKKWLNSYHKTVFKNLKIFLLYPKKSRKLHSFKIPCPFNYLRNYIKTNITPTQIGRAHV